MVAMNSTKWRRILMVIMVALCHLTQLSPLHGQPPPSDLDLTEETLKLLLKDHPGFLTKNRKLIDELKEKAPAARLAERDLFCVEIELKKAEVARKKLTKDGKSLQKEYERAGKALTRTLDGNKFVTPMFLASGESLLIAIRRREAKARIVGKVKRDTNYKKLLDAYWREFFTKAHTEHLSRQRINFTDANIGKPHHMNPGKPEEALATLRTEEEIICLKRKSYKSMVTKLREAQSRSAKCRKDLVASLQSPPQKMDLYKLFLKVDKRLRDFVPLTTDMKEYIWRLKSKREQLKPGALIMQNLRKKLIKACKRDENLAQEIIRVLVGDMSNPGGLVIK